MNMIYFLILSIPSSNLSSLFLFLVIDENQLDWSGFELPSSMSNDFEK